MHSTGFLPNMQIHVFLDVFINFLSGWGGQICNNIWKKKSCTANTTQTELLSKINFLLDKFPNLKDKLFLHCKHYLIRDFFKISKYIRFSFSNVFPLDQISIKSEKSYFFCTAMTVLAEWINIISIPPEETKWPSQDQLSTHSRQRES